MTTLQWTDHSRRTIKDILSKNVNINGKFYRWCRAKCVSDVYLFYMVQLRGQKSLKIDYIIQSSISDSKPDRYIDLNINEPVFEESRVKMVPIDIEKITENRQQLMLVKVVLFKNKL